ncbi:hypothetical protein MJG53_009377 [Ovis ammon polii x Ovis aries]|uniref:Uncharacterized protein n=1 Tax=Ovis ammon polii x Ovis aries TaxID=2918886 RepID=A0ACB9UW75_9CETA|nr:hypothetical protein MJG53_009377 [Ovis ammon polii x Ovis aries]
MHVNEPKVRARTIIVSLAVTSDLSSQEHMPPPSPEVSILISEWLWETFSSQKPGVKGEDLEPATPRPYPEARTVTPSPAPSTHNTRDASRS